MKTLLIVIFTIIFGGLIIGIAALFIFAKFIMEFFNMLMDIMKNLNQ